MSQKGKHKGGLKLATKKRKGLTVRIKEAINKIILENEDITPKVILNKLTKGLSFETFEKPLIKQVTII